MSNSRSPTTITCAAVLRSSPAAAVASSQRKDSFSSMAWDLRSAAGLSRRVQMRACTTPSNASSSASTCHRRMAEEPWRLPVAGRPETTTATTAPTEVDLRRVLRDHDASSGTGAGRSPGSRFDNLLRRYMRRPEEITNRHLSIPIATNSAQNQRPGRDHPLQHHCSNRFPPHIAEMANGEFHTTVHCRLPDHYSPETESQWQSSAIPQNLAPGCLTSPAQALFTRIKSLHPIAFSREVEQAAHELPYFLGEGRTGAYQMRSPCSCRGRRWGKLCAAALRRPACS